MLSEGRSSPSSEPLKTKESGYEYENRNMKVKIEIWTNVQMIFIIRRGGPVVIIEAGYGWDGEGPKQQPV